MPMTVLALVAALALVPGGVPAPAGQSPTLHDLGFMAGCWRSEPDERGTVIEEHYTEPSDNLMLGTTRYLRGGRASSFEFARITAGEEGIVLLPYPNGSPSSDPFRLARVEAAHVTFEAPEHDFPRRILYRLDTDGALVARIDDGTDDGQSFEWRMLPRDCTTG